MRSILAVAQVESISLQTVMAALGRIEEQVKALVQQRAIRDYYSTDEVAKILGKAEFTVREWCRLRRVHADKRLSGRGKHPSWCIAHGELLRIQREGLLSLDTAFPTNGVR